MTEHHVTPEELDDKFRDLRTLIKSDMAEVRTDLRERLEDVVEHLKTLNGRTGKSEIAIAVLEDRSERAEAASSAARAAALAAAGSAATAQRDAKASGIGWGAGAGTGAAGVLWALWQLFQKVSQP